MAAMGWLRRTIAGTAALALLAGLLVICPCSAEAASGDHDCCPQRATGMRAAEDACCLLAAQGPGNLAPAPEEGLAWAPAAALPPFASSSLPSAAPARVVRPAPSPPRVLRI